MKDDGSDVKRNEMFVKETFAWMMNMGEEESLIVPTDLLILLSLESTVVVRVKVVDSDSCM